MSSDRGQQAALADGGPGAARQRPRAAAAPPRRADGGGRQGWRAGRPHCATSRP